MASSDVAMNVCQALGGGSADAREIAALQVVIDDLTKERMAFQRGLERSGELMQTLADENEAMTQQFNAQARHETSSVVGVSDLIHM